MRWCNARIGRSQSISMLQLPTALRCGVRQRSELQDNVCCVRLGLGLADTGRTERCWATLVDTDADIGSGERQGVTTPEPHKRDKEGWSLSGSVLARRHPMAHGGSVRRRARVQQGVQSRQSRVVEGEGDRGDNVPAAGSRAQCTQIWDLFCDEHDVTCGLALARPWFRWIRRNADFGRDGMRTDISERLSVTRRTRRRRNTDEGGAVTLLCMSINAELAAVPCSRARRLCQMPQQQGFLASTPCVDSCHRTTLRSLQIEDKHPPHIHRPHSSEPVCPSRSQTTSHLPDRPVAIANRQAVGANTLCILSSRAHDIDWALQLLRRCSVTTWTASDSPPSSLQRIRAPKLLAEPSSISASRALLTAPGVQSAPSLPRHCSEIAHVPPVCRKVTKPCGSQRPAHRLRRVPRLRLGLFITCPPLL